MYKKKNATVHTTALVASRDTDIPAASYVAGSPLFHHELAEVPGHVL